MCPVCERKRVVCDLFGFYKSLGAFLHTFLSRIQRTPHWAHTTPRTDTDMGNIFFPHAPSYALGTLRPNARVR